MTSCMHVHYTCIDRDCIYIIYVRMHDAVHVRSCHRISDMHLDMHACMLAVSYSIDTRLIIIYGYSYTVESMQSMV